MNELETQFPKVFINIEGNIAIKTNAKLIDLFDAYSTIVHYIDGDVIIFLEELIKEKIKTNCKHNKK